MKKKITIKQMIITIIVVGLLSLIPYIITKNYSKKTVISKNETFKIGNLKYDIPAKFETYNNSNEKDYKYYSYGKNDAYCYIELTKVNNKSELYKDAEDYLKKSIYFTLNDEVETNTENDWFTITVKGKDKTTIEIASAITDNNTIYELRYRFDDYSRGENQEDESYKKCSKAYDYVFKSIKIEK